MSLTSKADFFEALLRTYTVEEVLKLVKDGADIEAVNEHGFTPLHRAIENGYQEASQALIAAGAKVNVKNMYGNTPLHSASCLHVPENVKLLMDNGADINAVNRAGNKPIHFVRNVEVARILISKGADPTCKGSDEETLFQKLTSDKHSEIRKRRTDTFGLIRFLIEES